MAICSFVFGLLFVVPLSGLIAVVLGWIARGRIRRAGGGLSGRRLAICGIALGLCSTAGQLIVVVAMPVNLIGSPARARWEFTVTSMRILQGAINTHNFRTGSFPTTQQGLAALVPSELHAIPKDAWGVEFVYTSPTRFPNQPYELISMGPDRQPNTPDDIDVWAVKPP